MKLKTRIIVGFGMSILVPLLLFSATLYGLGHTKFAHQTKDSSEVVYDISVGESTHSQTQVRIIAKDLLFTATVILVFTALSIGLWIYRSIATPLVKLKKATQNIKEGNLDFVLEVDGNDEFSELCRDFEEMRKRLKESAEEKVLMDKENKELISNISHDLKTPITAVKGYVEGIMDGVADTPEKIDRYVKTIYNKTNEMDHLINELTFYSKIDTNRIPYTFSKLNVEDYFSDCAEEVGLELETRGIELVYANYVEDNVQVIADGEQIRRVIHNIISNAIKYTGEGGTIRCSVRQLPAQKDGRCIQELSVSDNGIGMSEEFQKHIFESFTRERSSTVSGVEGTGLGMGIVKKLVEMMHGEIKIHSRMGEGSTFTIRIPCRIATFEDTQTKRAQAHPDGKPLVGKRILLAEDNDLNAEIAIALLEEEGLLVERAADGVKCMEMLEKAPAHFYELILMDIQMPILGGYDTTRKIRRMADAEKAAIPIIAMTANAFAEDKQRALEAGMNDHVAKPIDMNKLIPTLQKYI